jgi:hypothetical protein
VGVKPRQVEVLLLLFIQLIIFELIIILVEIWIFRLRPSGSGGALGSQLSLHGRSSDLAYLPALRSISPRRRSSAIYRSPTPCGCCCR